MRLDVASTVSEAKHIAKEESAEATRHCRFTRHQPVLCCLLLVGVCLPRLTGRALINDQSNVNPASASETKTTAVAGLAKRPVTVADSIQMTRLGDPSYIGGAPSKGIVA